MNGLRAWAGRWYRFARTDRMGRPHKPPAPEASTPRVPGQNPVPGQQTPPPAHGQPRPAPAPGPGDHGGDVTTVVIKRCGYMIITDHDKGEAEIYHGECDTCDAAGKCHLCGFYMRFDQVRRRWVQRYERCPAHDNREAHDARD